MVKLDRYIARNVFGAMMIVLFGLVAMESLFAFLAQLDNMRAQYTVWNVFLYTVLLVPKKIYSFIPFAALIGCLVGLGNMASNCELVVIRAAGVSLWRIVVSAMRPALVLVFFGVLLGEFFAPMLEQVAETHRTISRSAGGVYAGEGMWHREGNEFMYFNAVQPGGVLYGVSLYTFNKNMQLEQSLFAKRGIFQGDHWILEGVKRSSFDGQRYVVEERLIEPWKTTLTTALLRVVILKADGLSMTGLKTYSDYLERQGLDSGEYRLAFWIKVLQPLSVFSLVMISISFIFGPLRSVSMGLRVFSGVIVGIIFTVLQSLLGPLSLVFGFSPVLAVIIPSVICLVVGAVIIRRVA
ncbi:MAG: LPS export ABC transporter permease LptG [Candidatus Endonucleobacter bathymodioli]|uniref:LPS export ABC transporter permease LptG n=1 Tax=Candidatus Endonucleibacter bathymodioli TaxID=539814 RepID=A0AA90SMN3_9GAMM|nr:LPS export ABC transporter permease LptG [Candidatus Endonucleobacter bathymodioli]